MSVYTAGKPRATVLKKSPSPKCIHNHSIEEFIGILLISFFSAKNNGVGVPDVDEK